MKGVTTNVLFKEKLHLFCFCLHEVKEMKPQNSLLKIGFLYENICNKNFFPVKYNKERFFNDYL